MSLIPRVLRFPITEALIFHNILCQRRCELLRDQHSTEFEFRLGRLLFHRQRAQPGDIHFVTEALVRRDLRLDDDLMRAIANGEEPALPEMSAPDRAHHFDDNIGRQAFDRLMLALRAAEKQPDTEILEIKELVFEQDLYEFKIGDRRIGNYRVRRDRDTQKVLEDSCKIQFDVSDLHYPSPYLYDVRFAIAKEFDVADTVKERLKSKNQTTKRSLRRRTSFRTKNFIIDLTKAEQLDEERLSTGDITYHAELEVLHDTFLFIPSDQTFAGVVDGLVANAQGLLQCASGLIDLYPP